MLYFLANMVELSYETSHSAFNSTIDGRAMLYGPQIDDNGAEISPFEPFQCRMAALTAQCRYPCPQAKSVPFDEIVTNPSDPKHVLKLLGYSDGLGVVITTHKHLWNAV